MISLPIDIIKLIFEFAKFEDQVWVPTINKDGNIRFRFNRLNSLHDKLTTDCIALWPDKKNIRIRKPLLIIYVNDKGFEYDRGFTCVVSKILRVYPRHGYFVYIEYEIQGKMYRGTFDTDSLGTIIKPHKEDIYIDQTLYAQVYDGWLTLFEYQYDSLLKIIKY